MGKNRSGWQGKGDPLEDMVERWLQSSGVNYRRGDAMKTHLDFFLPDFNVYIECKRFATPRTNEQLQRAPDIIIIQGITSLRFLEQMTKAHHIPPSSNGRTPDFESGNSRSIRDGGTTCL